MARHSYIRVRKLKDASGFVDYISNESRQEHLLGRFEMIDRAYRQSKPDGNYWKDLGQYNRLAYMKSPNYVEGTDVIEAREVVAALPEDFYKIYEGRYDELAKELGEFFSEEYGVSSLSCALHLSEKDGEDFRNLHLHLIFSERDYLGQVDNIAKRNIWRDQFGASISKKVALELGEGNYTFIPKGTEDPFVEGEWGAKNTYLKTFDFSEKLKVSLTDKINSIGKRHIYNFEPLEVFDPNGVYLPTAKVGKNNNQAVIDNVTASNELVRRHNEFVAEVLFETKNNQSHQERFIERAREVTRELRQLKKEKFAKVDYKPRRKDRIENDSIDLILKPVVWLNLYKNASLQLSQWVQSNISSLTDRAKAFWADISVFDVLSSKKTTENASGGVIQRDIDR